MSGGRFSGFVLLAEMRTGSNFLEDNLNTFPDIQSYGELFNPAFMGFANRTEICGMTMEQRERDPLALLAAIRRATPGIAGFRFFHDHDPRVLAHVLRDPSWAKVVLTRNPLESYISRQIATATGQWKLTDARHRKAARVRFEPGAFEAHLERLQDFQLRLQHALQTSGQTAFYIGYEDLADVDVINGLAGFLGSAHRVKALATNLKKQNPAPLADLVINPREMARALAALDRFDLSRTPNFEPRRGAVVPGWRASAAAGLLHMPIHGGPLAAADDWLARHDRAAGGSGTPETGLNQKTLREWKRAHPGHIGFTVLRHPLARAHDAFCRYILATGPGSFAEIRATLCRHYGLSLPHADAGSDHDAAAHRAAFARFLEFLAANLAGQTSVRIDPAWASQTAVLQGMAQVALPDHLLREEHLAEGLAFLERLRGLPHLPPGSGPAPGPFDLARIYDQELEALARAAYQRDYVTFGFGDWTGVPAPKAVRRRARCGPR